MRILHVHYKEACQKELKRVGDAAEIGSDCCIVQLHPQSVVVVEAEQHRLHTTALPQTVDCVIDRVCILTFTYTVL